jgi:hypothetical protein
MHNILSQKFNGAMRSDERAMLKVGRIPGRHMDALRDHGTELKSGGVRVPGRLVQARARTVKAAPQAKRPLTESQHKAKVSKTRTESLIEAQRAERAAKQAFHEPITAAKRASDALRAKENAKADAAERAAQGLPPLKSENAKAATASSRADQDAVNAYRTHAAMPSSNERSSFYAKNRRRICKGAELTNSQNK